MEQPSDRWNRASSSCVSSWRVFAQSLSRFCAAPCAPRKRISAMLVLSRRQHQKLLLPDCATTIEVLRVHGNQVRLGITAPEHIRVMRHELAESAEAPPPRPAADNDTLRRMRHLLRNQVHTSTIGLALLRSQLQSGDWEA